MGETEPNMLDVQTPGVAIRHELDKRGWTQDELAKIIDRPRQAINEVISGKRAVGPEMAKALSAALGQTPEYWMRLESLFRLAQAPSDLAGVQHRARLYELAPVKEMERRGWIKNTSSASELERELRRFFGVERLDVDPEISVATRRPTTSESEALTSSQRAWCFRARQLAHAVHAEKFKPELLPHCQVRLRELAAFPDATRHVPTVLAGFGIRFVIVEPLAASRMDGAAFWVSDGKPVIAISARFDRIDAFWFTLAHEFAHIVNGDASVDVELVGEHALPTEAKNDVERKADAYAASMLIPEEKLQSFILRVSPLYSKTRINQFAHRMKIHPGIVVGQLHHRGEVKWSANREMLAKVRDIVTGTALTDGWGKLISVDLGSCT